MRFAEKLVPLDRLSAWRAGQRIPGRRVVVTNGCFDILHLGHATYLEAARAEGDLLLVGVNSDASVRALKGPTRPVNPERDRALLVAALGCVDAVCVFPETSALEFLRLAQPDVWAKGADYTLETLNQDERRAVESLGGRIAFLTLVPGKSTTGTLRAIEGSARAADF
jgi:D-glycero-beta-D-manno-heptose 1-phosphate adenylyltransferase